MKLGARSLRLRRHIVYWLAAIAAALVIGWPLFANGQSRQCAITSIGLIAVLFASLIHVGESKGVGRWLWGAIAALLSFGAPLAIEFCINAKLHYWWVGLGLVFFFITTLIFWRSSQDDGGQTLDR
jgi:hypothetical protein